MAKNSVHLPLELITEILLRLPVKSVLRCKCVCKSWLSLISNPNFTTSLFQLAASPTHRLVYLRNYSYDPKALIIDFKASLTDDSSYASLSLDFLYRSEIGGSCRGFLFLHKYKDYYLWNPSTGAHKKIPPSPETIAWRDDVFIFMHGFGYDPSRDDYLIVLGSYELDDFEPVSTSIDLEIFSLRANKWKQIGRDSFLPYVFKVTCVSDYIVGLFLSGALHWPLYNYETRRGVITAFDLKEMTISEIDLPDDLCCFFSPVEYDLLIFHGLISVWIRDVDKIDIWVMQEYAVQSSWTKILVLSLDPFPYFSPVCFTNCGHLVGVDRRRCELVKFNNKGQLLEEKSHLNCFSERSQMVVYTESLLSLPSSKEQAQEDD